MPPKRTHAFILAKASILGRTPTRQEGESLEVSSEVTPSVQRQLYPPPCEPSSTPVSPTTPDVTLSSTEAATPTPNEPLGVDIRINSRNRIHVEPTEEPVRKKGKRGIITGKAIQRDIANNENKRLPLEWNMIKSLPSSEKVCRISKQIGSIVREHVPMLTTSYLKLDKDDFRIVIDQLSVLFDIDWFEPSASELYDWIQLTARHTYNTWRTNCHTLFKKQGRYPIPLNFVHRPNQWDFLCTLFETQPFKEKSKRMTKTRASKKRIEHSSGPKLFRSIANELLAAGDVAPYLRTIANTTKSEDRKRLVEEEIRKIENSSDGILETVGDSIRCPIEKEISIIEKIVGPSAGSVVRGMGSLPVRLARMRGPGKGISMHVPSVSEENLRQQLAERDEEIRLLKDSQDEAKREAAKQREMIELLMKRFDETCSNSTTPTSHALG